ncbi:MAG: DNA replication and repair protein RecF [Treponema sp.]|nr:MAG: DNA replication and repair protein RecF [Treponema sp.]
MPLLSIGFNNFRNLENRILDLYHSEIFLVGKNGQGKTNLLEAIYLIAYGNSFRTRKDSELCKIGTDEYGLTALFKENDNISHNIFVSLKEKKTGTKTTKVKEIKKNLKKVIDRKELVNTIPCVLFFHDDIEFAKGNMEKRRFFLDQTLSMNNSEYIDTLRKFNKILKTRNIILKEKKENLLDSIDIQFATVGIQIKEQRQKVIESFNELFSELYQKISGIENIKIAYRPMWNENTVDEILVHLLERRQKDLDIGITMTGPQRDKIHFLKDKKPFTLIASTGQLRLLSLVLRTVQAHYYKKTSKRKPILLLDDVLLELDPEKKIKFIELLPEYDQLFCTFLPGELYMNYAKKDTHIYLVENGDFLNE